MTFRGKEIAADILGEAMLAKRRGELCCWNGPDWDAGYDIRRIAYLLAFAGF